MLCSVIGNTYTIQTSGVLDTFVTLYDGAGRKVASDDDSGADLNGLVAVVVTKDQTYFVSVEDFDRVECPGPYELSITTAKDR